MRFKVTLKGQLSCTLVTIFSAGGGLEQRICVFGKAMCAKTTMKKSEVLKVLIVIRAAKIAFFVQ